MRACEDLHAVPHLISPGIWVWNWLRRNGISDGCIDGLRNENFNILPYSLHSREAPVYCFFVLGFFPSYSWIANQANSCGFLLMLAKFVVYHYNQVRLDHHLKEQKAHLLAPSRDQLIQQEGGRGYENPGGFCDRRPGFPGFGGWAKATEIQCLAVRLELGSWRLLKVRCPISDLLPSPTTA